MEKQWLRVGCDKCDRVNTGMIISTVDGLASIECEGSCEEYAIKPSMTVEEMEKRWPALPPNRVGIIILALPDFHPGSRIVLDVDQDTIDDIIEYFQAAKEAMNS